MIIEENLSLICLSHELQVQLVSHLKWQNSELLCIETSVMISNGSEADIVGNCSDDLQVFVKAFSSLKRITCFGISEYCSRIAMEKSADP